MPPTDHEQEKIERLRRAMYSRTLSPQIRERDRRELERHPDVVGEDWTRPAAAIPSLTVAPRGITFMRSFLRWLLIIAVIFFVGSVSFFGYYFFVGQGSLATSADNIDISISGSPSVAGGEPSELLVSITNRNRVPLDSAQLVVTYPDGTRSVNDFRTDLTTVRQNLGTIAPGEAKQGVLNAVFTGVAGERKDVKVELEYRLANSNAVFVADTQYTVAFGSSPLSITVDGNTSTVSGQPVSVAVTVASNASTVVRDVALHADYPFGFTLRSADPRVGTSTTSSGEWDLGDIAPGEKKIITLNGVIIGQTGDDKVFNLAALARMSTSTIASRLAETPFRIGVAQTFLGLDLAVNGSTASSTILSPGETANVTINYVNNLPSPITDAVIVARLSGTQIDGSTVQTSDGFYRSADDVMLWDKTTTSNRLGSIGAGEKGSVSFSFRVPDARIINESSSPYINISINARGTRLSDANAPQNLQSVATGRIALASDLQLSAQGLYHQNPFGVVGPMPPQAGKETNYAIVITLRNTTNTITGAKVTAVVPLYVRWLGSHAPAGELLSFNANTSTFTWDVGDIAPGVGMNGSDPRQIAIAIGFNPSTSQIGQRPTLVQDITLTGVDSATGAVVTRKATPDITTNLLQISHSPGDVSTGTDQGFDSKNSTVVK